MRNSKRYRFTAISQRGASFIEILISVSIVLMSAFAAASFFSQQVAATRGLTRVSACKTALDSQLSVFRQLSSSANAYQWHGNSAGMGAAKAIGADTSALADPWVDSTTRTGKTNSSDILPPSPTAGLRELDTHLLLRGSVGYIAALYHSVSNICTAQKGVPVSSIPHAGYHLPAPIDDQLLGDVFEPTIRIVPYDLVTGVEDVSCPDVWARPQGFMDAELAANKIAAFPANTSSRIGYRVHMRGEYTEPGGSARACESADDFSLPVDLTRPNIGVVLNAWDPAVAKDSVLPAEAMMKLGTAPARPVCTHTPGLPASIRMSVGFTSTPTVPVNPSAGGLDPATVFLCRDTSVQVNPNYCPGAAGADMRGSNYTAVDAANAPWVPCSEVTACGIKADSVNFSRKGNTDVTYTLTYSGVSSAARDGLWGCDIKMDVATVDAAGNFQLLSKQNHPTYAGVSAAGGTYFQPVECWSCYKTKPFSWVTLLTIAATITAGALTAGAGYAVAGIMAMGAGAACRNGGCPVSGARFLSNQCKNIYPGGGKYFCRKVPTAYPAWFLSDPKKKNCAAISGVFTGFPGLKYSLPETGDGGIAESTDVSPDQAAYCEMQASCVNGIWEGVDPNGNPSMAVPMQNCGRYYTEKQYPSGVANCFVPVPVGAPVSIVTKATYNSYPDMCGASGTERCKITHDAITNTDTYDFPPDARTGLPYHGPNYRYYEFQAPLTTSTLCAPE